MINKVATLLTCLVTCFSYGQEATIAQVDSLYEVGFELRNGPVDSCFNIIRKSKEISLKLGYSFGAQRADIFSIFFYTSKGRFDSAAIAEKIVFDYFRTNPEFEDSFQHGLAYYYSGVLKWRSQNLKEARSRYSSALRIFTELKNTYYIATTNSRLGIIEMNQANYAEALDLFMTSYLMKLNSGRPAAEYAPELANIAAVYQGMGSNEEAAKYARLSLELEIARGNHRNVAGALLILGSLIDEKDPDSAIHYFERSFRIANENGHIKTAGISKYRVARALTQKGNFIQSRNQLQELLTQLQVSNYKDLSADVYQLLAINDFNLEEFESSIRNAKRSLELGESYGAKTTITSAAQLLSNVYAKTSKLDSALFYNKLYSAYRDSVHNTENQMTIARLNSKLDNLEIRKEVELLEKQREIDVQNRRLLIISLIAIVITSILFVTALVFRHKSNQRKQRLKTLELEREKNILDEELYQQTLRMINMNHGITELEISLSEIKKQSDISQKDVQKVLGNIKLNKTIEKEWKNFDNYFGKKHEHFYEGLVAKHPQLSLQNRRLAALIRIDLSNREIAQILNISQNSAKMGRYRLKTKLGLQENDNLTQYLFQFS